MSKQNINITGLSYRIRPVCVDDAEFIIKTRLEDAERNKYIHRISEDVNLQKQWIEKYLTKEDDYYFIVENVFNNEPEGLIGIYDILNGKAEWGRWVMKKGSMAAIESLNLICQAAFDKLGLDELYSHTIKDNEAVVSFHNSAKEKFRQIIPNLFEIDGKVYDAVEHYIDKDFYHNELCFSLLNKSQRIFELNLRNQIGDFDFHHIGVACKDFDLESNAWMFMGYCQESSDFIDETQGIIGRFLIAKNQPRLELLKNSENSNTLDIWLNNRNKLYHFGYMVSDFDKALNYFISRNAKIIRDSKQSVYFKKRICFLVLPNMFIVELIEK